MQKKWFFTLFAVVLAALGFAQLKGQSLIDNEFLKALKNKLLAYNQKIPQERVYLHTDKPFYKPGETLWFAAYLRKGETLTPSTQSQILYVELINPKGAVEKTLRLIVQNGVAQGDFEIGENMPGGLYKLRAFTNWMKNEPQTFQQEFVKEFQVQKVVLPRLLMKLDFERKSYIAGETAKAQLELRSLDGKPLASKKINFVALLGGEFFSEGEASTDSDGKASVSVSLPKQLNTSDGLLNILIDHNGQAESISRAIPIQLDSITLEFFPEGGDIVAGQPTRIAFRALNDKGKPTEVAGEIRNSSGQAVAKFVSYHDGMGAFELNCKSGQSYRAYVPALKREFALPDVQAYGYTLIIKSLEKNNLSLVIHSSYEEELSLVVSIRSKIYFTTAIQAKKGPNPLDIPLTQMPAGIAVITLFDSREIERAERLVFVNAHRKLNIALTTDKAKYQPREKVELSLSVTDEKGLGIPGQFSLAVVDDKLFTFADDKQGNILSQLLLEQDLAEKVEEAAFYFDPKEEKAPIALDYLLMSRGWRRFEWAEVMQDKTPERTYPAEKAVIGGTVIKNGIPAEGVDISLSDGKKTKTEKDGSFLFENVWLFEPVVLKAKKDKLEKRMTISEYGQNYTVEINEFHLLERNAVAKGMKKNKMVLPAAPNMGAKIEDAIDDGIWEEGASDEEGFELGIMPVAPPKPDLQIVQMGVAAEALKDVPAVENQLDILERKEMGEDAPAFKPIFYRARVFPKPIYQTNQRIDVRTDFRSTIFWDANITTDRTGKAKVVFYNSDEITAFRVICEGIGKEGTVGRAEMTYATQLPFSMDCKLPTEVTMGDEVLVNLVFSNHTNQNFTGKLQVGSLKSWKLSETLNPEVKIAPNGTSNRILRFKVQNLPGKDTLYIALSDGNGNRDAFIQPVETGVKGFPVALSASGQSLELKTSFNINQPVKGTLRASLVAYPSVVDDLLAGIESILKEPYGCFEQTSSSTYPNIVVLNYLNQTEYKDEAVKKRALQLIEKGYQRLVGYETKENGYEWFGGVPAHEALTAYGLMEFKDMEGVYGGVNRGMIDRTAAYLNARKDGKGGFLRNPQALDAFGGASPEITNAYIVYAMAEAGYGAQLVKEFDAAWTEAQKSKDPYTLALLANAVFSIPTKTTTPRQALDLLYSLRNENGSWTGKTHSITRSGGQALTIETTALAALAFHKTLTKPTEKDLIAFREAAKFLVGGRNAYGGYWNTQATVLALKALAAYAAYSKQTAESGDIEIWVAGKKVAQKHFEKGARGEINIEGLEQYLSDGKNDILIKFKNCQNALPYTLSATYSTLQPGSSKDCTVSLKTELAASQTKVGETIRLNATLTNTTADGQPMTLAVLGIPAGLAAQPWQLKKMQEEKVFDFYEIIGNRLAIYYRQMKPSEVRNFSLDLKAEIAGRYEAPASTAYLYYTAEHKNWQPALRVEVK